MCTPATHHAQAVRYWGRLLVRVRVRVRVRRVQSRVRVRVRVGVGVEVRVIPNRIRAMARSRQSPPL